MLRRVQLVYNEQLSAKIIIIQIKNLNKIKP
jgi:hypothetical protein